MLPLGLLRRVEILYPYLPRHWAENDLMEPINIIEITSIFELRLSQGTRHVIHLEGFVIRLFYLFELYFNNKPYQYNLDLLEI
jgi:hypothetical protein